MNLRESIRRIIREETELPLYIRRRVTANDLERLVRDVKISISGGKDKSDALYDAIQNFISSNRERFKDYKWSINHLPSLIKYINSKLDEEPLNESILREETEPEYAVIEITKPLARMEEKYYYQIVPYWKTKEDKIYINKGASGRKTISTDNIKVLKTFKGEDNPEMKEYLNKLRG
jgi:hypothetical protein